MKPMEPIIERNYLIKCYQYPNDSTCELVLLRYYEFLDDALFNMRYLVTRYPKVEFLTVVNHE